MRYTNWGAKAKGKPELAGTKRTVISGRYELEDIVNHSKNKMDIVRVGDYINGRLVIDKAETYKDKVTYVLCNDDCMFFEEDIRSIVTAEQYKSVEYVF